eukprot:CAMPEP_0185426998 /NCGR_PEP_ID=MMETSP1365-20130426/15117_1 /TAXON_ID=38817 /ORGANISM="Gephyrocapsa oceanica, Strain RCC1303" /LENGTH=606 /DNA_ID=CAMNT_0028031099 /DNA_START=63 /DNA_END=1880 /DNA_ORIENTATION=-
MLSATSHQQSTFLRDAFTQLDTVVQRKREAAEAGRPSGPDLRRSQQVIQRWLVLFARQHLHAICNKLMTVADASDKQDEALAAEKNPRRKRQVLPSLSAGSGGGGGSGGSGGGGGKTNVTLSTRMPFAAKPPPLPAVDATDSVAFFLLDCLRRVLAAAADVEALRGKGSGLGGYRAAADATSPGSRDHARRPMGHLGPGGALESGGMSSAGDALAPLRGAPDGLLAFCYSRLHVGQPAPIQRLACECVGILSLVRLSPFVGMLIAGLSKVSSDRDEREWVSYQRGARHIHLSTHSAEQAGASMRYLKAVAAAMGRTSRGVLRLEMCRSLSESLSRLMAPPDETGASEWREYCASGSAVEWWSAFAAVYSHAARWAQRKAAHAPFCLDLMARMLALASREGSAPGGPAFASSKLHSHLLLLLAAALRRETARQAVLPTAAFYVGALPAGYVAEDIGGGAAPPARVADPTPDSSRSASPHGSEASVSSTSSASRPVTPSAERAPLYDAAGGSPVRAFLVALLPRRYAVPPREVGHVEAALLALGRQPAGGEALLAMIAAGLRDGATPPPTRSVLLRALSKVSESCPPLVDAHREALWPLVLPPLAAAA